MIKILPQQALNAFHGGIQPPEMKSLSNQTPIGRCALPDHFIIPLQQHAGPAGTLLVSIGQQIYQGQALTRADVPLSLPVHAPTSGVITAILPYHDPLLSTSTAPGLCIALKADGLEHAYPRQPLPNYQQQPVAVMMQKLLEAGIAGLGGAGFPTTAKWLPLPNGQSDPRRSIELLIINGAECEPYITADDRLMQEYAHEIVQGCHIVRQILQPQATVIAIEENKPQAIQALTTALQQQDVARQQTIMLRILPTRYPSGGAKQLILMLTGKEVPQGQHAISIGIVVHNVATLLAIQRAIVWGEPLIERVVTVTGAGLARPGNVWARLGTPVSHLLNQAGLQADITPRVIVGGPLMGLPLNDLNASVIKTTNCLLVQEPSQQKPIAINMLTEQACIRCGHCADVCPANLLPQQLYWYSRGAQHEQARAHHLFDCIECGACAYVCPSQIPLVAYYRQEKQILRQLDQQTARAKQAKARFEAKQARLARQKQARQQRYQQAVAERQHHIEQSTNDAIPGTTIPIKEVPSTLDMQKAAATAAIARAKARQAALQKLQQDATDQ